MTIKCPHCNETEARTELRQPVDLSLGLIVLGLLGGMIGGLFYMLGQETKYECGRCKKVFFSHTTVSRIFLALCVITYAAILAVIVYGIWDSIRGEGS
jgi:hypothetical protein